ncbi:cysteinyl-tRNA synthetase [Thalassoporum mexicanum PCC 7367]|uniref:cysteine--tRNA ligase n=1 Tax=Thalassoporum mexicanum TaxID=3457544 RepID=UPI00029F8974|nr:cysteine--tRNA ligase [Pseudanabaena sp. PCC 7367]AFY70206.1 cysteinyl-tRNA synthetase [Pseudanabaena sp. PCC 7367]
MSQQVYNSLTRQKEELQTLEPGQIKMYVCGVTVYDFCHLGHARAYVVWDMVRRYLQSRNYQVRYVQNITDIDDKILKRAQQEGVTMQEISDRYIATYNEDMARLNIMPADEYPRATESIEAIIDLIKALEAQDYAYAAGGDVYYAVQKFPTYGKLSGRKLADMQAGASGRVAVGEELKRYPFDFALWKAAKPGEPFWQSPWGEGRPGWHIECSAMVRSRLGDQIDIHAGGADLQFPHHENEIAQSEGATHQPLARYWLHNGFVNIDGEKMSKSLGNFTTIRELLKHYDPMAIRLFILQSHYRQPIDFTEEAINAATRGWETIRDGLLFKHDFGDQLGWDRLAVALDQLDQNLLDRFHGAMDDDFNTSIAISLLFELAKPLKAEANKLVHSGKSDLASAVLAQTWQTLSYLSDVLGFIADPEARSNANHSNDSATVSDDQIETMVQQRCAARKAKDFAASDRLRDQLKELGITLIDQPDGTTRWHR